ncbi:MAG: ABC transporter substrate-binding protein [Pseudomonadota bacterium]
MSMAMNRDEINEVAYVGLGVPVQDAGFSPRSGFVANDKAHAFLAHDPAKAMTMLDGIGVVDTDGDGFRELPSGDTVTLDLKFST